ncbi:MAG: NYN domain-containing protein [Bacteroidota bacterium]
MIHYIIDGNNLIGKVKKIKHLQHQNSRETLALRLDGYFQNKNCRVTLHFDGFPNTAIRTGKIRIMYSEKSTADEMIKFEIEAARNRSVITVITSDHNLIEFSRVCRCRVMLSEKFAAEVFGRPQKNEEEEIIGKMSSSEFRRLFGEE